MKTEERAFKEGLPTKAVFQACQAVGVSMSSTKEALGLPGGVVRRVGLKVLEMLCTSIRTTRIQSGIGSVMQLGCLFAALRINAFSQSKESTFCTDSSLGIPHKSWVR